MLLVDGREAARMLAISPRKLWAMTFETTPGLPYIRCGRLVRYPVDDLRRWIDAQRIGGSDDTHRTDSTVRAISSPHTPWPRWRLRLRDSKGYRLRPIIRSVATAGLPSSRDRQQASDSTKTHLVRAGNRLGGHRWKTWHAQNARAAGGDAVLGSPASGVDFQVPAELASPSAGALSGLVESGRGCWRTVPTATNQRREFTLVTATYAPEAAEIDKSVAVATPCNGQAPESKP